MNTCNHSKRIHERPVVLMPFRLGDLKGIDRSVVVRCYACGMKWVEDNVFRPEPKGGAGDPSLPVGTPRSALKETR